MNAPFAADNLNSMKFAIGQPVPRQEDPTLLKGEGRYSDDVNLREPGLVRDGAQPGRARHHQGHRHAEAKTMPGVLGVWTGADLNAAGYGPLKTVMMVPQRDGSPMKTPTRYSLATDKVRFVGDPVAFVVAETLAQAKDAAEAVVARHRVAALRHRRARGRPAGRARSCSTTCRAMSAPTTTTATRPRSTKPSPRPRTSRGCA